jgi:hypothetical protein
MSLAYAVQTKWSATVTLTSLIPASRLFTGRAPKQSTGALQALPYASFLDPDESTFLESNAGIHRRRTVTFEFWVETKAAGDAIERAIELTFKNWSTTLSSGWGRLINFAPGPSHSIEEDDPAEGKIWHYRYEFTALTERV